MLTPIYEIDIANEQSVVEIDEDFLLEVSRHTLAEERVEHAEISIAIVDNGAIHELNRQFLKHDYPTDVLSFSLDDSEPEASNSEIDGISAFTAALPRGAGRILSGEVVVSAEMALQTAFQYHWNPRDELALYLVHGLLHLCGYDDLTEHERQVMRTREREILQHWNLLPHYAGTDDVSTSADPLAATASGDMANCDVTASSGVTAVSGQAVSDPGQAGARPSAPAEAAGVDQ